MLTETQIYAQLCQLPEPLQREVLHYIQWLVHQQTHQIQHHPLTPPKPQKRKFGSAASKYQLAADFDVPLEDFKDYMP